MMITSGEKPPAARRPLPHIDAYEFGCITIDGRRYRSDVLITPQGVHGSWWRRQGHSLCPEDLSILDDVAPEVLIIGCGASSALTIPPATRQWISDRSIRLIDLPTDEAAHRYNELATEVSVVAGLHLTC